MSIHPKTYDKETFIGFLEKNNVSNNIITKFAKLPDTVVRSGDEFTLDVNSTWYNVGDTHYSFEMNYYSNDLIEYLFSSKVFEDIEICINNSLCELRIGHYINIKDWLE